MSQTKTIVWVSSVCPYVDEIEMARSMGRYNLLMLDCLETALAQLRAQPADLVFVNFPMANVSGLEALEEIQRSSPGVPIVFRDVTCSAGAALKLAKSGLDYLVDSTERIADVIQELDFVLADRSRRNHLKALGQSAEPWRRRLVGESAAIQQISEIVRLVGPRRCTVLVTGETGTGKEVLARAIHESSPRAGVPLVAVNCSALPESLLEAELFGHVKGAFTGAQQLRAGRFEQAHKGTLFLDEVGDMPLDLQAKLLRVLQEREFQRLGSSETVRVDVRVIAATNADLLTKVKQGQFRADLYYRLNVVPLAMPALRDRLQDVPELVQHFLQKVCRLEQLPDKQISREALAHLSLYSWPGNIRQLENAVEVAVILSGSRKLLLPSDFPLTLDTEQDDLPSAAIQGVRVPDYGLDFEQTVSLFERDILSQALRKTGGNKKMAADMLRLKRTTLSAKVRLLETAAGCPLI